MGQQAPSAFDAVLFGFVGIIVWVEMLGFLRRTVAAELRIQAVRPSAQQRASRP